MKEQQKEFLQVAILQPLSAANPVYRESLEHVKEVLNILAKETNLNIKTKFIDHEKIFTDALKATYNKQNVDTDNYIDILKNRLFLILKKKLPYDTKLCREFAHIFDINPQILTDTNRIDRYKHLILDKIYNKQFNDEKKKNIQETLTTLKERLEGLAEKRPELLEKGLSLLVDYTIPGKIDELVKQEEISILGSMLMGKWGECFKLDGKIYDEEKRKKITSFVKGHLEATMDDVDYYYEPGNEMNIASPGVSLNSSREIVTKKIINYCLHNKTPMINVCGGLQRFYFHLGGIIQRIGVHGEEENDYLIKADINDLKFQPAEWEGTDKVDKAKKVLGYLKEEMGYDSEEDKLHLVCGHTQAILYDESLAEKIYKIDPQAIILTKQVKSANEGEYKAVQREPKYNHMGIKIPNRGIVEKEPKTGIVTIIEAVIYPNRRGFSTQNHPDEYKEIIAGSKKISLSEDNVFDWDIDFDKTEIENISRSINWGLIKNEFKRVLKFTPNKAGSVNNSNHDYKKNCGYPEYKRDNKQIPNTELKSNSNNHEDDSMKVEQIGELDRNYGDTEFKKHNEKISNPEM